MRDAPIRLKVTLILLLLSVVGTVGVVVVLDQWYESSSVLLAEQSLSASRGAFVTLEQADTDKLAAAAEAIAVDGGLREAYLSGDPDILYGAAEPLFSMLREKHGITHWYFIRPEPDSTVYLRVHNKDIAGDRVERETYRQAVETDEIGAGLELGQTAFALRVVVPYRGPGGDLIGYVELGQEIDDFLGQMKEGVGSDYALWVKKSRLDRESWASVREVAGLEDNWDEHPTQVLIDSTVDSDFLTTFNGDLEGLPPDGRVLGRVREDGRAYMRGIFPVRDASGASVGGVLVLTDITEPTERAESVRSTLLIVIGLLAASVTMSLLVVMNRLVFARLDRMIDAMEEATTRLLGGDLEVAARIDPTGNDEIGRFEAYCGRFLEVVADTLRGFAGRS